MFESEHWTSRLVFNSVVDRFVPDRIRERGGVEEFRARLIPVFAVGLILAAMPFSVVFWLVYDHVFEALIIAAGMAGLAFAPLFVRIFGRIGPASHWISLILFLEVVINSAVTGGIASPAIFWMVAVPVYAVVLGGRWGGVVWFGVGLATFVAFYFDAQLSLPVVERFTEPQLRVLRLMGMAGLAALVLQLFVIYGWMHRWLISKLRAIERDLREEDRRKNHFLALLGHELRNPLSAISTGLSTLRLRTNTESAGEQIEIMTRQTQALRRILDDLLDFSRMKRGEIELQIEEVDLRKVLGQTVASIREQPEAARRRWTLDVSEEPIRVLGDPVRLEQIFANLLNNAVQYTDEDGTIRVRAGEVGERVEVRVEDDGRGMAPEETERVFEMFERGTSADYDAAGGLGVGLSIARRLLALHDGTVEVEKSGPDQGSSFLVSLPVSEASSVEVDTGEEVTVSSPVRIAIVDDDRDVARSFSTLLDELGYEVRTAHSGAEALEMLESWAADVVFLDLGMPEMDGFEVAERLGERGDPPYIVALSGHGRPEDLERTAAAGFDDHLVKPPEIPEIVSLLEERGAD